MQNMNEEVSPVPWWRKNYVYILVLLAAIGITVAFVLIGISYKDRIDEIKELENYGYPFVFFMGIAGSASPIWPFPGSWAAFFWAGWAGFGWGIPLVAVAAGTGEAIGEISGYMLGFGSQPAVTNSSRFQRFGEWLKRHGTIAIFLASAVPSVGVTKFVNAMAGAARFPARKVFIICLAGKIVKSFGFALAGVGLLSWVTDLF